MESSQSLASVAAYPMKMSLTGKAQSLHFSLENLLEFWDIRREVRRNWHSTNAQNQRPAGSDTKGAGKRLMDATTEAAIRNMAYEAHMRAAAK